MFTKYNAYFMVLEYSIFKVRKCFTLNFKEIWTI